MIRNNFACIRVLALRFIINRSCICRIFERRNMNMNLNLKPPNILVYTGNNCPQRFKEVEESLLQCLNADNYIVYHLLPSEISKNPWMENSLLLVVSSDTVDSVAAEAFEMYFKNFGNILFICSKIETRLVGNKCLQVSNEDALIEVDFKSIGKVFMFRGKYSYDVNGSVFCKDNSGKPLIVKITQNKHIFIYSEIYLDRELKVTHIGSEYNKLNRILILKYILNREYGLAIASDYNVPEVSPGYFICDKEIEMANILKNLKLEDITKADSTFYNCKLKIIDEQKQFPIYFYCKGLSQLSHFNEDLYFSNLGTDVYGHCFVYFPVVTSTMEVAEQLSEYEGIVIAAGYQVSGRGRGSNKWISPKGCAMFTLHFTVPLQSNLGKQITLLQHIAALAVVHGIKSQLKYKDLDLKIKWPNDIYYGKTKIGGLICTTVIQKSLVHVNIGWGINVANSLPTSCLNDCIYRFNSENSSSLPHLHIEELIAITVSQMEYFIRDFIEFGSEKFFVHYYLHWMHSNQTVTLEKFNQQGIITGIDEYGFLKIKTADDKILVFQPDGNRFDIMKNLIHSYSK